MNEDAPAIEIVSPPHDRPASFGPVASPPTDVEAWQDLKGLDGKTLCEMGLGQWNDPQERDDGKSLFLLPGEWYWHIPSGYEIVDIFGRPGKFIPGETDDDTRYGFLSFGILVQE